MNNDHQPLESHESSPSETASTPQLIKHDWKRSFFSSRRNQILALGLLILALGGFLLNETYRRAPSDQLVRIVSSVFPLPAVVVNGDAVSLSDYLAEYDALMHSFETASAQGTSLPAESDIQDAIVETIINKTLLRQLAKEHGVSVSEEDVDAYYQDILIAQESEETFEAELETTFGWTVEEFKERIVEPIVLLTAMTDYVLASGEIQSERLALMQSGYERLEAGEDFDYVADEIHAQVDPSPEADLGYVKSSVIPEGWLASVEALEVNDYTEIQSLYEGYAVFQVLDRIVAGEDTQMHLYAMTVPKKTLEEILVEYRDVSEIKNYLE